MKKGIFIILMLLVASCTIETAPTANENTIKLKVRCIDGVEYYLFKDATYSVGYGFMSPKYKKDGSISLCK